MEKKNYPQVYLEELKYRMKKKKMTKLIKVELASESEWDSGLESDIELELSWNLSWNLTLNNCLNKRLIRTFFEGAI